MADDKPKKAAKKAARLVCKDKGLSSWDRALVMAHLKCSDEDEVSEKDIIDALAAVKAIVLS